MNGNLKSINTVWEAGRVTRYHTCPTIGDQNIADHSHGVAMGCLWLTYGKASAELLKAALYHDIPELWTGDIPAPAKKECMELENALREMEDFRMMQHGLLTELTVSDHAILKTADTIELLQYCVYQINMGNNYAREVLSKGHSYLEKHLANMTEDLLPLGAMMKATEYSDHISNLIMTNFNEEK